MSTRLSATLAEQYRVTAVKGRRRAIAQRNAAITATNDGRPKSANSRAIPIGVDATAGTFTARQYALLLRATPIAPHCAPVTRNAIDDVRRVAAITAMQPQASSRGSCLASWRTRAVFPRLLAIATRHPSVVATLRVLPLIDQGGTASGRTSAQGVERVARVVEESDGKTDSRRALRSRAGSRRRRRGRPVLQAPVLGAADSERRDCSRHSV